MIAKKQAINNGEIISDALRSPAITITEQATVNKIAVGRDRELRLFIS